MHYYAASHWGKSRRILLIGLELQINLAINHVKNFRPLMVKTSLTITFWNYF